MPNQPRRSISNPQQRTNKYDSPIVGFGLRFASVCTLLISPFAIYHGMFRHLEARDSVNWPSTICDVHYHSVHESNDRGKVSYHLYVHYRYAVDGTSYHAERITPNDGALTKDELEQLKAQYPPGSPVRVFYNPADPGSAFLEPGDGSGTIGYAIFPWLLPVMGIGLWVVGGSLRPATTPAVPTPGARLRKVGLTLIGVCAACLMIGGVVGRLLRGIFPEQFNQGLTPTLLIILVPIWTVGACGLIVWLAGKVRDRFA